MSFISIEYVVLFISTILIYYLIPHRFRWIILLAASWCFYMFWKPSFIILLLASTGIDYYAAIGMSKTSDMKKRKKFLLLSLFLNLGLLGFFKYFGMLDSTVSSLLSSAGINYAGTGWNILLPIGISFYTFQTIGYTIDVYRGTVQAERHFGYFALYVSFFPQLVAGPIERASNLLPQLRKKFRFDYAQSVEGMMLICWGFLKKTVIADRLAVPVDAVFANPEKFNAPQLLFFSLLFLYQLYFDFSSYTDIARGTAKILGIELMENFRRPFAARTISDLWSRWHISLTSWFASYVSIPLYKKFRGFTNKTAAHVMATVITLSLCGLWHGADWSFLAWGLFIAICMITGNITRPYRNKIKSRIGIDRIPLLNRSLESLVILTTVAFAMVFFRAPDIGAAIRYFSHMLTPGSISGPAEFLTAISMGKYELMLLVFYCLIVEIIQYAGSKRGLFSGLSAQRPVVRHAAYLILIMSILVFGIFTGSPYVYFQF